MSDPIRVLIVDDESLARTNLRLALGAYPHWLVQAECASAAQAHQALLSASVDVVFLDIQMPRENGLEFARTLAGSEDPPIVVFVTAFEAFAIEAFELHALDYLLKPFDDERLRQTLTRAEGLLGRKARAAYAEALRDYMADTPDRNSRTTGAFLARLSVRSVGRIEAVPVADILWVKAAGNYVDLRLPGRSVLHRVTLTHLERRLDPAMFIRVHRSALVRRDECVSLTVEGDGIYALQLRCGESAPVSERYVDEVRALLGSR